jgi:dihydropteroate synthase
MEYTINVRGQLLDLGEPCVMGILNVTPDSFYEGSRKQTEREIAERACRIIAEGGRIIDVGAYSTRPGARKVSEQEEMERLRFGLQVVRREQPDAVVSVDTFRPDVARMAVEEYGADIINDVSEGNVDGEFGGTDSSHGAAAPPAIFRMVARLRVPYILMSVEPAIEPMMIRFAREVQQLRDLGQKDIILDPGFGFGKTIEQNYAVLRDMNRLLEMELPVLAGLSRKSMVFRVLGTTPAEALNGTTALHALALERGASILRVHDVREAVECCLLSAKLKGAE